MYDFYAIKNSLSSKQIKSKVIPLFVYGTLRRGERFDFYLMDGAEIIGNYIIEGCVVETDQGDFHIDKSKDGHVSGELYHVNFSCLLRIFHLENSSGSFPKKYELYASEARSAKHDLFKPTLYFDIKRERIISGGDIKDRRYIFNDVVEFLRKEEIPTADGMQHFIGELII